MKIQTTVAKQYTVLAMNTKSLLVSARRQKVNIPLGCSNGGCGMCKVKIVKGEYELGLCSKAALSDEERQSGYVLACKTQPKGDIELILEEKVKQS